MIQLLIIAALVLVFYVIQVQVYNHFWDMDLDVELSFQPNEIYEGDEGVLVETITNNKWLPLPLFQVKFKMDNSFRFKDAKETQTSDYYYRNDAFHLGRQEKLTRNLKFVARKRGLYYLDEIDLTNMDLFLVTKMLAKQEENLEFYVYPKRFYSKEFISSLQMVNGLLSTRAKYLEDPFIYRGIREYQPYDERKNINWKATAKTGDLKVNLHDYTAVRSIRVFVDLSDEGIVKKSDCQEACIQMATGICHYFSEKGMKVSCYCNTKDPISKEIFIHKESTLTEINRSLARIDLKQPMVDFEEFFGERLLNGSTGEFTFIVSLNRYDNFVNMLENLGSARGDFLWFYAINHNSNLEIPETLRKYCKTIRISQIR